MTVTRKGYSPLRTGTIQIRNGYRPTFRWCRMRFADIATVTGKR